MKDTQLYAQILGVQSPWKVNHVELELKQDEVRVYVEHAGDKLVCPDCGKPCTGYDRRERRWRLLP